MIRRLRWKVTLITTLLAAALLAGVCGVFLFSVGNSLRRASMEVLYRAISETEAPQWSNDNRDIGISLPYFTVTVTPNGGTEITSSQFYDLSDYDRFTHAVDAALSQGKELGELSDESLRYLRQATEAGWRMAFVDVSYERSVLHRTLTATALVGIAGLGVIFGLSLLLARWAVTPVERSMEQQRQFVADASHELKTPLTIILSNAELVARQVELSPEVRRWTENIRTGGAEMQSLVEQLLTLERSDQRQGRPARQETVHLSELTENALLLFEPVAYEAGRTLEGEEVSPGLFVQGDPEALSRLLDILLDNAVKYTPPGGRIRLTLEPKGNWAELTVANQGEPIPEQERERIFDRFYRSDAARTGQGFGLGLAIARTIVQEHGGTLRAASEQGWNRFRCQLPQSDRE